MFLTEYYVAFKQMCLIIALHLCLNCVYVYMGYTQTRMQLKEWDGLVTGTSREAQRGGGALGTLLATPAKKKKMRPGLVRQWLLPPLWPSAAAMKGCNKAQSMPFVQEQQSKIKFL